MGTIIIAFRPFSMDEFSDYEKHFTVMNYQNPSQLKQIHYDDFIGLFEQQYPNHKWIDIQVISVYLYTARPCLSNPSGLGQFSVSLN